MSKQTSGKVVGRLQCVRLFLSGGAITNGFQSHAEIEEFGKCFGTPEFIEGTTAFMEKRKAEFRK